MLGAKYAPTRSVNSAGEQLILSNSAKAGASESGFIGGMFKGTWNQMQMLFGKKLTNTSNPQANANIYTLARENAKHNWNTLTQQVSTSKNSMNAFETRIDQIAKGNPKLQESMAETLGTNGKVNLNPVRTESTNAQVQDAIQQFAKEQPIQWNLSQTTGSGLVLGADGAGSLKKLQDQ